MTHSLHRRGDFDNLKGDYVILAMLAAGKNDKHPDARQKLLRIAQIFKNHNPTNILTEKAWRISSVIQAAFTEIEDVSSVIQTLKKEDLGISIVVSGLLNEIEDVLKDVGLEMHTVHLSLGTFGKKELLPSDKILEITTMCGHHCISPQSVEYYLDLIKKDKISIENAAEELAKPCICGIFNTSRATNLLGELSKEERT
jgi:hypothetical protein